MQEEQVIEKEVPKDRMLIYMATIRGQKSYVGCRVGDLQDRIKRHYWQAYSQSPKTKKYYFHNAIKQHGKQNVQWKILEDNILTKQIMLQRQKYYIKLYNTLAPAGYNQNEGGRSQLGYRHSQQCKRILRQKSLGQNNPFYGKKHTDETRQIMKKNHVKYKEGENPHIGYKHTQQSKRLMKKNHADFKGQKCPFYGKHHTQQTKDYLKEINSGQKSVWYGKKQSKQHLQKRIEALKGKPQTQERREKIRQSVKRYYQRKRLEKQNLNKNLN